MHVHDALLPLLRVYLHLGDYQRDGRFDIGQEGVHVLRLGEGVALGKETVVDDRHEYPGIWVGEDLVEAQPLGVGTHEGDGIDGVVAYRPQHPVEPPLPCGLVDVGGEDGLEVRAVLGCVSACILEEWEHRGRSSVHGQS